MNNIFKNACFGKAYKTRDERRAIYQCGDDEIHHLFLDSCDILVDSYGYINCKEIPSGLDIVSEWKKDTIQDKLDLLPAWINLPSRSPLEEQDEQDWYAFNIAKNDNGEYIISYYCWLREETLVEFTGDYSNVINKMYDWCKEHEYIKVEHEK